MKLPETIRALIAERLQDARANYPAALSADGRAILVDGGVGYGAYVSPEGDVFMETYDIAGNSPPIVDRSPHAQRMALALGSTRIHELADLLPRRSASAKDCVECQATGCRRIGPTIRFICSTCAGVGWVGEDA